jgi:hypothetical protein
MPMVTLRIQHAVPTYEAWKRAFDSDPVDRRGGGVRRYRVQRPVSDPKLVMIDLEFDTREQAESFVEKLRRLWSGPGKAVMIDPETWILETVESREL